MNFNTLWQRLQQCIQPHRARQLATEHGWCQRTGKVSPFEFLFSALGQSSALELTLNAQASALSQPVSRQAIDQRYNPPAVAFFQAAYQEVLTHTLAWKTDSAMARLLRQRFTALRLFDSTQCLCSEALAQILPACGGDAGAAGFKILLSFEYGTGQLHPLAVLPAKCSDQGLAGVAAQQIGAGELGIFDKGFYQAQALRQVHQRGGYFLIPWPHGVGLWQLQSGQPAQPLELAAILKATTQSRVEYSTVALGQTQKSHLEPVRLVACRLPEQSVNRRRAALRENCRKQGRQPTQEALELAGWLILLTNAPAQLLPSAAMGYLYRVRWQIELVFKQCKSVLRLDVLPSDNVSRVQCEVWARLLTALLTFVWYQHTNATAWELYQCEMSFAKVAKLLQQHGQSIVRTLFTRREHLFSEWRTLWNKLLKLARKERQLSRSNTWENLCTHWLAQPSAPGSN